MVSRFQTTFVDFLLLFQPVTWNLKELVRVCCRLECAGKKTSWIWPVQFIIHGRNLAHCIAILTLSTVFGKTFAIKFYICGRLTAAVGGKKGVSEFWRETPWVTSLLDLVKKRKKKEEKKVNSLDRFKPSVIVCLSWVVHLKTAPSAHEMQQNVQNPLFVSSVGASYELFVLLVQVMSRSFSFVSSHQHVSLFQRQTLWLWRV